MKWKPRSIAGAIALGVLLAATVMVGLAPAASAAGTPAGDAVTTNPMTNAPVLSGGSSTSWTLNLPAQAACRGDTASQGYHVYSFIVPAATDVGSLTFNPSTGPSSGNPLVDNTGSAYIAANTAATTGQVIGIPTFNFNLFATTSMGGTKTVLAPGDYKAGIACANTTGQGDQYWETIFTFTANGGDPNGEVWTARPDHAVVTTSGCKASTTSGAEMGQYPAWPGDQSYLRVACIFKHSNDGAGDFVSSTYTIHDFSNVVYHNGAARTITNTAAIPAAATTFTATDCTSMTGFVNRSISTVGGVVGLGPRTFVTNLVGCTVNLNEPTSLAIPAGTSFLVENSSGRAAGDATVQPGAPMIQSATANFTAADNGMSVTGTNIPDGSTLIFVNATQANLSIAPTAGPNVNQLVTFGGTLDGASAAPLGPITTTRTIDDATFTATNQITSTAARFFVSDVGLKVSSTVAGEITPPCYIQTRNSATLVTLSSACDNGVAGTHTVTIGDPSVTAPISTDTVLNQGAQLALNPALLPGSPACSLDQASAGLFFEGTWLNPGSFVGGAFATQPPGTKAIGEILFQTAVVRYGAYVLEIPGGLGIDPLIGGYHFNIVFPNVPTGLVGVCPSTPTSRGVGFSIGVNATTASQGLIPTSVGRPATTELRSTRSSTTGSTTSIFITDDINGAGVKWLGAGFNRTCIIPAGTPDINFVCGDA